MTFKYNKNIIKRFIEYINAGSELLSDVYVKPSALKEEAFMHCLEIMDICDGWRGRIISYNRHVFTFAFIGYRHGVKCFFVVTRTKIQYCEL